MTEILTTKQMQHLEALAINGSEKTSMELMYKASMGVYNNVNWYGKIGILCGKGNNGGDGYALALILKQNGIKSEIIMAMSEPKQGISANYYFKECKKQQIEILDKNKADLSSYDILVDAIFGTGFFGEISSELKPLFEAYNKSSAYKVSIDINSGLNSDTGLGDCILKSDITVSIGSYKIGHLLNKSRDYIKNLINVDIGIKTQDVIIYHFEESDAKELLKDRDSYSYKGTYGTVTIIGGCIEYSGAIKLANLSACAVRAGCGISRLAVPKNIASSTIQHLVDSTLYRLSENDGAIKYNKEEIDFLIANSTVIAYGMGTSENEDGINIVRHLLKNFSGTLILDAGGLRCLAKIKKEEINQRACALVLTPHLGEMKALYKEFSEPLDVIKYAEEIKAVVLLKGNTSIITNGKEALVTNTGCPGMAKGGSGDVLSGIVAGFCATRNEKTKLLSTVALAAYINGIAGQEAQNELCDISMSAYDTALNVAKAIAKTKK